MGQLGGVLWVYFKALIFHDWPWNGPGLTDWWVAWWMSYKFSDWLREIPGLLWGIRLGIRSPQEGNWGLQGVSRRYPHYLCHKFWPKVWWFIHQNLQLWQQAQMGTRASPILAHQRQSLDRCHQGLMNTQAYRYLGGSEGCWLHVRGISAGLVGTIDRSHVCEVCDWWS